MATHQAHSLLAVYALHRSVRRCGTVPTVVPKGVILVKGATPGSSDSVTPLPEEGKVAAGRYSNAYFGLSYPIPAGWTEQPAGPPPSERRQLRPDAIRLLGPRTADESKHTYWSSAQDLFFSANPAPVGQGADGLTSPRSRAAVRDRAWTGRGEDRRPNVLSCRLRIAACRTPLARTFNRRAMPRLDVHVHRPRQGGARRGRAGDGAASPCRRKAMRRSA